MNNAQAIHSFWSSFGWSAYDENTVPDDAIMPYITYEVATANIGKPVILNASLWDRSTSWRSVEQIRQQIAERLGYGGITVRFDDGMIFLTQGTPFAQRLSCEDDTVRRINLNVAAEFVSAV